MSDINDLSDAKIKAQQSARNMNPLPWVTSNTWKHTCQTFLLCLIVVVEESWNTCWYLKESLLSMPSMYDICFWKRFLVQCRLTKLSKNGREALAGFSRQFQSHLTLLNVHRDRNAPQHNAVISFLERLGKRTSDYQPDCEEFYLPFYQKLGVYSIFVSEHKKLYNSSVPYNVCFAATWKTFCPNQSKKVSALCKVSNLRRDWQKPWHHSAVACEHGRESGTEEQSYRSCIQRVT